MNFKTANEFYFLFKCKISAVMFMQIAVCLQLLYSSYSSVLQ